MSENAALPVLVPFERLDGETLQRMLEDFATRDGTDYGETELSLNARVQIIHRQLRSGEAKLVFYPGDESLQLITAQEAKRLGLDE